MSNFPDPDHVDRLIELVATHDLDWQDVIGASSARMGRTPRQQARKLENELRDWDWDDVQDVIDRLEYDLGY